MKREKKQIEDKRRNNNFAAAFAYLKSTDKENYRTQGMLAEKIGVDGDTITNILRYRQRVSEDTIVKLQEAVGGIFNFQFLRGQSDIMLAADLVPESNARNEDAPDSTAALLAAKDEVITEKNAHIADLRGQLSDKDSVIRAKEEII